ncbi:hypothetical protein BN173_2640027 [Clostridioides difficile T11]|nr:hypothetical protein BN173_2640027 [Clostridioides difficile T11]
MLLSSFNRNCILVILSDSLFFIGSEKFKSTSRFPLNFSVTDFSTALSFPSNIGSAKTFSGALHIDTASTQDIAFFMKQQSSLNKSLIFHEFKYYKFQTIKKDTQRES